MTNCTNKPLIRIAKGSIHGRPLDGKVAVRSPSGGYGIDTHCLPRGYSGACIDEWGDTTPVPTAALQRLQDAFRGVAVTKSLEPSLLEVLSYLSANKPSALEWAVVRVKDAGGPMISGGDSSKNRLSLLFDTLASIAVATNKAHTLVTFARICVDWANVEGKRNDSLEAVRRKAYALSISHDFITLSTLVADVITAMGENLSPYRDLIAAAAYALAWAAQIIEEEG